MNVFKNMLCGASPSALVTATVTATTAEDFLPGPAYQVRVLDSHTNVILAFRKGAVISRLTRIPVSLIDYLAEPLWPANFDREIAGWQSLGNGWDGEDAAPPPVEVVQSARAFLDRIALCRFPTPELRLASDGEISFVWRRGDGLASISFDADGDMIVFVRNHGASDNFGLVRPALEITDMDPVLRRIRVFLG